MQYECKHGLPVRVNLTPPEPTFEGMVGYTWTVTVNMCKECVAEGTAEQIAQLYEDVVMGRHLLHFRNGVEDYCATCGGECLRRPRHNDPPGSF